MSSILSLDSAHAVCDLGVSGSHTTELDTLTFGQLVESLEPDVEAAGGSIDSKNVDSLVNIIITVVQLIAFATVRRTPPFYGGRSANGGEIGQATEGTFDDSLE
jgi:hypothetical protein